MSVLGVQQNDSDYTYVCLHAQLLSRVQLFAASWTIAHLAPLSMGLFKQEHWSGLSVPPLGNLPNPEIKFILHWQVDSLPLSHMGLSICMYMGVCVCVCMYYFSDSFSIGNFLNE